MPINQVEYPANLTAQADFSAHGELIETRFMDQVTHPQWAVAGVVPQGVVFQIGAAVYRADADETITGTTSDYVRISPQGDGTALAAYVADLTGVSWSAQYNGYYDGSGNLYVFDEGKALAAGEIASVFGRYLQQRPNGDVYIGGSLFDYRGNEVTAVRIESAHYDTSFAGTVSGEITLSRTFTFSDDVKAVIAIYPGYSSSSNFRSPVIDALTISGTDVSVTIRAFEQSGVTNYWSMDISVVLV